MTDKIIKEYLSQEGIEFIQQSCKQEEVEQFGLAPEEIERIKAITPQQWVDMMRPLFSTPLITGNEVAGIFVTEEAKEEILKWGVDTDVEDLLEKTKIKYGKVQ